jgi:hypothetical protein
LLSYSNTHNEPNNVSYGGLRFGDIRGESLYMGIGVKYPFSDKTGDGDAQPRHRLTISTCQKAGIPCRRDSGFTGNSTKLQRRVQRLPEHRDFLPAVRQNALREPGMLDLPMLGTVNGELF